VTDSRDSPRIAHLVHRSLLVGVVIAASLMVAGLCVALVSGHAGTSGPPRPAWELVGAALAGDGVALMECGVLVLILTPVGRVIVLTVGWVAAGERRFAAVASVVLALLVFSIWLGVG
jgi:uncharacterized membrane protein